MIQNPNKIPIMMPKKKPMRHLCTLSLSTINQAHSYRSISLSLFMYLSLSLSLSLFLKFFQNSFLLVFGLFFHVMWQWFCFNFFSVDTMIFSRHLLHVMQKKEYKLILQKTAILPSKTKAMLGHCCWRNVDLLFFLHDH